jgi:hypothetical protein
LVILLRNHFFNITVIGDITKKSSFLFYDHWSIDEKTNMFPIIFFYFVFSYTWFFFLSKTKHNNIFFPFTCNVFLNVRIQLTNIVVIGTDHIGRCKSNYHLIVSTWRCTATLEMLAIFCYLNQSQNKEGHMSRSHSTVCLF